MTDPRGERLEGRPVSPMTGVGSADHLKLFAAARVPVLQNRVYRSSREAMTAPCGRLEIRFDQQSQFAWNAAFDPTRMQYDREYDNCVPSDRFYSYYDDLADHLVQALGLAGGTVLDIGCGNGIFLSRWMGRMKQFRGIGVDPAYSGPASACAGRLRFIADTFRPKHVAMRPALILCRHLLEHVENPVEFLQRAAAAARAHDGIPLFVEVPDLDWILVNRAYWDFCYEHCNYFTADSLAFCMERAGMRVEEVSKAFGGQYL
ncbi:MAG: class I SAM-dependent methyltransferase, partial [Acidobacteriota bacterium]